MDQARYSLPLMKNMKTLRDPRAELARGKIKWTCERERSHFFYKNPNKLSCCWVVSSIAFSFRPFLPSSSFYCNSFSSIHEISNYNNPFKNETSPDAKNWFCKWTCIKASAFIEKKKSERKTKIQNLQVLLLQSSRCRENLQREGCCWFLQRERDAEESFRDHSINLLFLPTHTTKLIIWENYFLFCFVFIFLLSVYKLRNWFLFFWLFLM